MPGGALPLPPPVVGCAAARAARDLVGLVRVEAALRGRLDVVVDERAMWTPCDTRSAEVVEGVDPGKRGGSTRRPPGWSPGGDLKNGAWIRRGCGRPGARR